MTLKDNLDYWQISLSNLEPIIDDYYVLNNLIIEDKSLIEKIERLRELIISYCVLCETKNKPIEDIFDEIYLIVTSIDNIQYHEFIAFWKVLDISYSIFKKLPNKKPILKHLLSEFCQKRRKYYDRLGYTNVTVQALYDIGSSRKKGNISNIKIIDIINKHFNNPVHSKKIYEFENNDISFFLADRGDKRLFKKFCEKYNIKYEFCKQHQGKILDIVLKISNHIFLIEAKHVKEGGGAQNKQIVELIDFIGYSENSNQIHYVSFMDGIYFNKFATELDVNRKVKLQKAAIENNLNSYNNNFFVNTSGLNSIFKDILVNSKEHGLNKYL